jgi:hypothetical protein
VELGVVHGVIFCISEASLAVSGHRISNRHWKFRAEKSAT